jgi:flagellar hook-length control protein FliK
MDFAADAVIEMVAPPPHAAGAKARPSDPEGPSFEQHLRAAAPEDAAAADAAAQQPQAATETDAAGPGSRDAAAQPASGAASQAIATPGDTRLSPLLFVQLMPNAAAAPAGDAPAKAEAAAPALRPPETAPVAQPGAQAGAASPLQAIAHADASKTPAASATSAAQRAPPQAAGQADMARAAPVHAPATPAAPCSPSPGAAHASTDAPTSPRAATAALPPTASPVAAAALVQAGAASPADAAHTLAADAAHSLAGAAAAAPRGTQAHAAKSLAAHADPKAAADEAKTRAPSPPQVAAQKAAGKLAPLAAAAKDLGQPAPAFASDAAAPATTTPAPPSHVQHAVLDHNAARTAPATAQVAREIVRRFDGVSTRFELRLDPPELGRVEVRLEVSRDHRVTAVVAADNPQALSELARHARDLEQALQSAGLELGENGLSFDLRERERESADADADTSGAADGHAGGDDGEQAPLLARPVGLERWRGVRLDMMV